MAGLVSDLGKVTMIVVVTAVLGIIVGALFGFGSISWVVSQLVVLVTVGAGWRFFEWHRSPLRVTAITAVALFLVGIIELFIAIPVRVGILSSVLSLLVGVTLSQVRPEFFDTSDGEPTQTGAREGAAGPSRTSSRAQHDRARAPSVAKEAAVANDAGPTGSVGSGGGRQTSSRATEPEPTGRLDVAYDAFVVGDHIGSGGNADVHLATIDLPTGEHEVALKTPRVAGDQTVDTDFFEQFREEAETWDRLDDHEHVVTVYDWGETPQPWIALEYMEAGDLNAWRDRLDLDGKLAALVDVTEAVHHAHTHGVNHTDLKPGNVLFTERTGDPVAKVGDWGLANVLLEHSQSVEGFTPDYAAPEQVDPEAFGRTDHQTDVYQLGVVTYELLTGQLPFEKGHQAATINAILNEAPEPPSAVNPELPAAVDDAVLQALSKEKADRQDAVVYLRDAFREMA